MSSARDDASRGAVNLLDALAASGEVGADLAAVDWAATPLGDPAGWDSSLATIVRAVVSSRFSMWMAWGPELTFFCNDAYRRDTLGAKYPWALGRSSREVWAEIWDDIGPRIAQVMSSGQATWDESLLLFLERSGYTEETYHTFSYSPLADDRGEITGMLCVVTEETERVIGERRMATLREVGAVEGGGRDEHTYLLEATAALGTNNRSLPFTLIYLVDDAGDATLAGTSGTEPGEAVAPLHISAGQPDPAWPTEAAMAGRFRYAERLTERFGQVPTGDWPEPPKVAAVVPLLSQVPGVRPVGFLVAGANKYRPVDDSFRSFVELLASQIASGVASARAYETERKRAEELARLDAVKTTFFTNVSHELRTPLTLLLAPAEDLLATGGPRTPGERQRLELIVANAQRLLKLVNTLLDFSRLETGRAGAHFEPVDLSAYTVELTSMFESAFVRSGLTLEVDCQPLSKPVWVDREMWAKIVLNLVSNALKYTLEGRVVVRLGDGEGGASLTVTDTGIGIREEDQSRLFERFHRVEGSSGRSFEGTGIGLALVAELVTAHGGHCTVASAPGTGSTFGVEVPYGPEHLPADQLAPEGVASTVVERAVATYLAEVDTWIDGSESAASGDPLADSGPINPTDPAGPAPATAIPAAGAGVPRPSGDPSPTVLIVDDNANMRDYVTTLLGDQYTVRSARDGVAGLEAATQMAPDLILTDVMMPRMNGFELLSALRSDPRTIHIPVLMLSARAGEEGMIEGLEAGADDYLVKPFSARELTARVAANLELDRVRRVRDQLQSSQHLQDQAERLAQVGSWEVDLAAGAIRTSHQFREMSGAEEADLARMAYGEAILHFVVPEDRDRVSAAIEAAIAGQDRFESELRFVGRADRQMLARGEVLRDEAGTPVRLRGYMQDISQQREAERAIATAAAAQQAAEREHAIADELQRSLLPSEDLSSARLEVATFYRSGVEGTRAGGDFFDVIDLGGTRTAVIIGDVSGRGVRAASLMGQLRAAIHAHARLDLPPAEVLEQLDQLVRDLGHGDLVTCIYGIHDALVHTLVYASAGHLPPLLRAGDGEVIVLPGASGPPLGAGSVHFGEHTVHFPPAATLLLYTDGLVERRRVPIDDNIDRVRETLAGDGDLADLTDRLVDALGAHEIDDDVAILAVTSAEATDERSAEHDVAAAPTEVRKARRWAAGVLDEWEVAEVSAQDVVTIVSELVTNAITYGRPPVRLRLRMNATELLVEVDDALSALPRRARMDIHGERGRGLWIVSQLAQRWSARPNGSGKTVWCSVALGSARRAQWLSSAH